MIHLPKVWDLIEQFKYKCRLKGWWVSDHEDVVHANGEYHNFLGVRRVHPNTFKSVATNHYCPIREGLSYRTVNVSYRAWVFSEHPSENLVKIIAKNPSLLKSTALYDLSEAYGGKPVCLKINETRSVVFHEFEVFLEREYHLSLMDRLPPLPPEYTPSAERIGLSS